MERDLVEEVGRIHRYGSVPEAPLVGAIEPPPFDRRRQMVRAIEDRLAGAARFHQVLSYSFTPDDLLERTGCAGGDFVRADNPVAPDMARIRREVLPSLLGLVESARRERDVVRLFELGKGYRPEEAGEDGMPREVHQLAMVLALPPTASDAPFDAGAFFQLRAAVDDVISAAGVTSPGWASSDSAHPCGAPRQAGRRLLVRGPRGLRICGLHRARRRPVSRTRGRARERRGRCGARHRRAARCAALAACLQAAAEVPDGQGRRGLRCAL